MATMDEVTDEAAQEVVHKMQNDPEYAEAVVEAIASNDDLAEKMVDDMGLASKVAGHLLTSEGGLMDKVRGELEAEGLSLESGGGDEIEYDKKQAAREFQVLAKAAKHKEDPASIAKACDIPVTKTMQETDFSNAGVLIQERLLDEIIPILVPDDVFMGAGAVTLNMEGSNKIGIGRQNQDPVAYHEDESSTLTESDADFDKKQLDGKKITAMMGVSNDFLQRDSIITANAFLSDRMMTVMRNTMEQKIFRGPGSDFQPQGALHAVDQSHRNTSSGNTITDITNDFREAIQLLEGADVPNNRRRWFMRRDVLVDFVFDINSDEDTFPFREEIVESGTMLGDRVLTTNNIEKRTNDSNIYYLEMSEQYVGIGTDFRLSMSEHAQFSDDNTLMKLIAQYDYEMKHDKSAAVVEDYTFQSA